MDHRSGSRISRALRLRQGEPATALRSAMRLRRSRTGSSFGLPVDRTKDFDRSVTAQNRRGEWVPSIPLPFFSFRKVCRCGAKFWTMRGYGGHYARDHIVGMD